MLKQNHIREHTVGGMGFLLSRARAHMLSFPALILLLSFLAGAVFHSRTQAVESGSSVEEFVSGEVVVKLASSSDLVDIAAQYKLDPTPLSQFGNRPIYRLRIADGASVISRVGDLQADSQFRVVYAEPNYLVRPPQGEGILWSGGTPVDGTGSYLNQWATEKIRLSEAHAAARGAGVRIAVLDSGVDATHPLLENHLLPGYDFVDMDNEPGEVGEIGQGAYGHGTHVTGLLALVAPEAKIIPLRVLDKNGIGNIWILAEALEYAVNPDGDVNTNDGAQVINMSVSTPRPTNLLQSTLRKITYERIDENGHEVHAVEYNNIVVAAAGNSGTDIPEYPAAESFHAMLAVAASDENDTITSFSTRGPWVGLLAPGQGIVSTVPGGGYAKWSGTSMAAPLTAGVAALVRSALPNASNSTVISHLVATSKQIAGPVQRRLDAGTALSTEVKPYVPPPTIQFSGVPPTFADTLSYEPKFYGQEYSRNLKVTVSRYGDDSVPVSVDYATSDKSGQASCEVVSGFASSQCDYSAVSGTLNFAAGERFKEINITIAKEYLQEGNETFALRLSNPAGAKLNGKEEATLVIFDSKILHPAFEFARNSYTTGENVISIVNSNVFSNAMIVDVTRTGDLDVPASVELRTIDESTTLPCNPATRDENDEPYPQGRAYARCDYATTIGILNFAPGERMKHVPISIINDAYDEPAETFQIILVNPSGATINGANPVTVTIMDDDEPGAANPIVNDVRFFVRQQYLDFLNREPDAAGFADWQNVLNNCGPNRGFLGSPSECDRVHVSSGFYRSPEFTERGYLIYRFYEAVLGRLPLYREFIPDMAYISGYGLSAGQQEQKVAAFTSGFMQRQEFADKYGPATAANAARFISALEQTAKVTLPEVVPAAQPGQPQQYGRPELIARMESGQLSPAEGLRAFIEQKIVFDRFFYRGFVAMQYFGYLRRDPDQAGYDDWVDVLEHGRDKIAPGDYRHLIFGFIYSEEYRKRFGQP
jgi:thermitase